MQDERKLELPYCALERAFANPDMKFAPYEFWFFDQDLDTLGVKPQEMAHELSKKGFNPGYAHARINYAQELGGFQNTPLPKEQWLSEKWFQVFEGVLKQAQADGTHFSFTDEYGWPSLQAAGRILEEHPELRSQSLSFKCYDLAPGEQMDLPPCFFAVSAIKRAEETASFVRFTPPSKCGTGIPQDPALEWAERNCSFDMSSPYETSSDTPYNFSSAFTEPGDGSRTAEYLPAILAPGRYRVFSWWTDTGRNATAVPYQINGTTVLVDQSTRFHQWNEIGSFDFDPAHCSIVITNKADGRVVADAIKLVPENGPAIVIDDLQTSGRRIAYLDSGSLNVIDGLCFQAPADAPCRVYVFQKIEQRGYDGSTVNYLDRRLPDEFLKIAYKPYEERCADFFGTTMGGVFSDHEGDYGYKLAWSDDLEQLFVRKSNLELKRVLPLLIDRDVQGTDAVVRFQWFDAVSDLYSEAFGKVSDYAERLGLYYVMHTWEESLQLQAFCVGDYFKLSRRLSLPGTDALVKTAYNPQNYKDTFSVSEFEGRRFMNEVMALISLNDYTPAELKKQANYLACYGVSHVITHALKMTRDLAQNIVSPDFYNIDPCWNCMDSYSAFVRRTSFVNSCGHANAHVLLLNPMDSVFALAEGDVFDMDYVMLDLYGGIPKINAAFGGMVSEINQIYGDTIRALTRNRVEHLTADKHYIRQMEVRDGALCLRQFRFDAAILPPMWVIDLETANKLLDFVSAGGSLYTLGELPSGSIQNGRNDPAVLSVMERLLHSGRMFQVANLAQLEGLLETHPSLSPAITVQEGGRHLLTHDRVIDGKRVIFIANQWDEKTEAVLAVPGCTGKTQLWDPVTGERTDAAATATPSGMQMELAFAPFQSWYLVIDPLMEHLNEPLPAVRSEQALQEFTVSIDRGNTALLHTHHFQRVKACKLRVIFRKGAFNSPSKIHLSSVEIKNGEATVLKAEQEECFTTTAQDIACREYAFEPQAVDTVVLRTPSGLTSYRVEVWDGNWWSTCAEEASYSQNEVITPFPYPQGSCPANLTDWNSWDFLPEKFAGVIDYHTQATVERTDGILLKLGLFSGCAEVFVNGNRISGKLFEPFEWDLSGHLTVGENSITIRVANTIASNLSETHGGLRYAKLVRKA